MVRYIWWEYRGGLKRGQKAPALMSCLSRIRNRPAKGKIKSADSTMVIWKNEWNGQGQLPPLGESISGSIETQYVEHKVITGIPDTNMPMVTIRMKCFLMILKIGSPLSEIVPRPL